MGPKNKSNYALTVLPLCCFVATAGVSYNLQQRYTHSTTLKYHINTFKNGSFANSESAKLWRKRFPAMTDRKAAAARLWLIKRMKALQRRPPPTLQTVREQWA